MLSLPCLALGVGLLLAPTPQKSAVAEAGTRLGADEVAARGLDSVLGFDELDEVLLARHGLAEEGRAAAKHLVQSLLLEQLAREEGVVVTDEQVQLRWDELDRQIKGSGDPGGLASYLEKTRMDEAEFRRFLRLSYVHEILTRRALAIPESRQVSGEQQTLWIEQVMAERGYEMLPRPWEQDVVARCGEVAASVDQFRTHLRQQLSDEDVRDACYETLLERRVRQRMPDLSEEAVSRAIDEEIARRRFEAENDPRYQGVPYETLLGAQGMTIETVREDPAVRVAALSRLWVDRSYTDEHMRQLYEAERDYFDGRFGEAVLTYILFRRAAKLPNELNPRSFEEAERELDGLRDKIQTLAHFERLVERFSEDAGTREKKGLLGWVTREAPRVPAEVRAAVFEALAEGRYPRDRAPRAEERVLGPVRVSNGAALLFLGDRRPAPVWEGMKDHVHRELRRRFLQDVLPRAELATYLDTD